MVRAILEGRKTQTRRVVKMRGYEIDEKEGRAWPYRMNWAHGDPDGSEWMPCPYGKPGDRLWVRETWAKTLDQRFLYRADTSGWEKADLTATGNWKPSIHMPRAASRITLEITDVRVERLQDITWEDAIAEGIYDAAANGYWWDYLTNTFCAASPIESYKTLWNSINGEGAWAQNPFVWVIQFKLIKP